jgi:hypothetical protein
MMFRALTAASIFVLTVTTIQADAATVVVHRVPQSANDVCGSLLQSKPGSLFYQTWFNSCMRTANAEITKRVDARTGQYRAFASK